LKPGSRIIYLIIFRIEKMESMKINQIADWLSVVWLDIGTLLTKCCIFWLDIGSSDDVLYFLIGHWIFWRCVVFSDWTLELFWRCGIVFIILLKTGANLQTIKHVGKRWHMDVVCFSFYCTTVHDKQHHIPKIQSMKINQIDWLVVV
jgi:hypothetical protein